MARKIGQLRALARRWLPKWVRDAISQVLWLPERALLVLQSTQQLVFEWRYHVHVRGKSHHEASISIDNQLENIYYKACGWLPLRRALKRLRLGGSDVVVDLGSGKGQALIIAGAMPIKRVIGVELDPTLAAEGQSNIVRARPRLRAESIESLQANALDWEIPDDVSVVVMFNPFVGSTFQHVIDKFRDSLERAPRNLYLVYGYPWEHDWLLTTGRATFVNVQARFWPTRPFWWLTGQVIVTYRLERDLAPSPSLGRGSRWEGARARWSRPNGQVFTLSVPGARDFTPDTNNSEP